MNPIRMMKRLIPLVAGLFAGLLPAFAQMLPDSTVQVVAYWELGDKQIYQVENVKYEIEKGDTTVVEKSAQILEIKVVAADEEKGYRLKVTTMESQYSDPTQEAMDEAMRKVLGADAYYFETDPHGEFLRALPPEGLEEQQEALVQAVWEAVKEKKPEAAQLNMLPLIRQMLSPEAFALAATGEISPLFMYHGSRFDIGKEFPVQDEIPALIGGGTMKMDGKFWVDEELTDNYSVVLHMYKEADQEQLKPVVESVLGSLIQTIAPDPAQGEDVQASMEEAFRNARMALDDYIYEEIHLGSGWPVDWSFSREMQVVIDGESQGQLIEKSVRIIVED